MKKILSLAVLIASVALTACGGGEAPATVTQVPVPAAMEATVPVAIPETSLATTVPTTPPPWVAPAVTPPSAVNTADVVLSGIPVNVKRSAVNVGQRNVNFAAFNVAFDKDSPDASIQELVFRNVTGGDVSQLFTQFRFVDENGDVCPIFYCYVQWGNGDEARVVFTYGWRPQGSELKTYALQGDISPNAPAGAAFAFELVGVQMRQWGKTVEAAEVKGKVLEVTTIVALPIVSSSQGRQIMGATVGMQYEVLNITLTCPYRTGCLLKEMKVFIDSAENVQMVGAGTLTPLIGTSGYLLQTDYFIGEGVTVTLSLVATATSDKVYAQWYDAIFLIDGTEFSPAANPVSECIDVAVKGGGNCYAGGKG